MTAMLFAVQFGHQHRELRDRIDTITRACHEILHSERLARCFELVLAIGNLLNAGTELEDAHGVTLASLLKVREPSYLFGRGHLERSHAWRVVCVCVLQLSETKSIDRTTTLLQFIVKLIHVRRRSDPLCLAIVCALTATTAVANASCAL